MSEAIYELFNTLPNYFNEAVGGRLYKEMAPTPVAYPYSTYHIISNIEEWNFYEEYNSVLVQFNVYSKLNSSVEVENISGYVKDLYNWCTLDMDGFMYMRLENSNVFMDDDNIWIYALTFRVYYQTKGTE